MTLHEKLTAAYWEYFERHKLEIFATDGIDGKVWHQGARVALEILLEEADKAALDDGIVYFSDLKVIVSKLLGEGE